MSTSYKQAMLDCAPVVFRPMTDEELVQIYARGYKQGRIDAFAEAVVPDEWLTTAEAMTLLKISSTGGFKAYRDRHGLNKERIHWMRDGKGKLWNKARLRGFEQEVQRKNKSRS